MKVLNIVYSEGFISYKTVLQSLVKLSCRRAWWGGGPDLASSFVVFKNNVHVLEINQTQDPL